MSTGVARSGCGSLPAAAQCLEEAAHRLETTASYRTRKGRWAATRAPASFPPSVRSSWEQEQLQAERAQW